MLQYSCYFADHDFLMFQSNASRTNRGWWRFQWLLCCSTRWCTSWGVGAGTTAAGWSGFLIRFHLFLLGLYNNVHLYCDFMYRNQASFRSTVLPFFNLLMQTGGFSPSKFSDPSCFCLLVFFVFMYLSFLFVHALLLLAIRLHPEFSLL